MSSVLLVQCAKPSTYNRGALVVECLDSTPGRHLNRNVSHDRKAHYSDIRQWVSSRLMMLRDNDAVLACRKHTQVAIEAVRNDYLETKRSLVVNSEAVNLQHVAYHGRATGGSPNWTFYGPS